MWAQQRAESLGPKPAPHEERNRQHQRPGTEVKAGAGKRADRRNTLIQRLLSLIGHWSAAASQFAGVADAAGSAALAPFATCRMTGVSDCGKRSRVRRFVTRRG